MGNSKFATAPNAYRTLIEEVPHFEGYDHEMPDQLNTWSHRMTVDEDCSFIPGSPADARAGGGPAPDGQGL